MNKMVLLLVFIFTAFLSNAEVLELKNGSIINGKIIKMDEDTMTIISDIGEIVIDRENILTIYQNMDQYNSEKKSLEKTTIETEKIVLKEVIKAVDGHQENMSKLTVSERSIYQTFFVTRWGLSSNIVDEKVRLNKISRELTIAGAVLTSIGSLGLIATIPLTLFFVDAYIYLLNYDNFQPVGIIFPSMKNFYSSLGYSDFLMYTMFMISAPVATLSIFIVLTAIAGNHFNKLFKTKVIYNKLTGQPLLSLSIMPDIDILYSGDLFLGLKAKF